MMFVCTAGHTSRTSPCPHCPAPARTVTCVCGTSRPAPVTGPCEVCHPTPGGTMSYTKNALERAAERLRVPIDELTSWLMTGKYRPMPELEYAARDKVSGPVGDAAAILRVHPTDLARWLDARDDGQAYGLKTDGTAELVSEDDYRGVAADLIARWADDHVDGTTVLASLNLAAHGMPVT